MAEARFPSPAEREKRGKLVELLDEGKVLIGVDVTRDGVELPPHLMERPVVWLALSRRFGLDVFEVGPLEIRANLSFGGVRHLCVVPWVAVFQMTSEATGEEAVFADALSPPVLRMFATALQRRLSEAEEEAPTPTLVESPGGGDDRSDGDSEPAGDEAPDADEGREESARRDDAKDSPPRRPHLRLVD